MLDDWNLIGGLFTTGRWLTLVKAFIILAIGLALGRLLASAAVRLLQSSLDAHAQMIVRRVVFYLIATLAVVSALHQLGFRVGVLLGAAGIVSIAVGFASQTSISNLISGLFLVGERPFGIGDMIRVGTTTGEVLSVDLLSVKLRTLDNLYVRIPNETLIKTEMTNLSRFPIRRADLLFSVAYKEDLKKVQDVLLEVADRNPLCLEEPRPVLLILGFGESGVNVQFNVWTKRENFLDFRFSMQEQIRSAFMESGIEFPFPHRSLYAGSVTGPIPVQIVDSRPDRGSAQE